MNTIRTYVDEALAMARRIAPLDLRDFDIRVELVSELQWPGGGASGLTGTGVRVAMGRASGCSIIINDAAMLRSVRSVRRETIETVIHEIAHGLAESWWVHRRAVVLSPATVAAATADCMKSMRESPAAEALFDDALDHDPNFIRVAAHLAYRLDLAGYPCAGRHIAGYSWLMRLANLADDILESELKGKACYSIHAILKTPAPPRWREVETMWADLAMKVKPSGEAAMTTE